MDDLQEFYRELDEFDWLAVQSEDRNVWLPAFHKVRDLATKSRTSNVHSKLYHDFCNYAYLEGPKPVLTPERNTYELHQELF